MSLKVIGAGYGRTGTLSLKAAFEELGFGKCYHMKELIMDPSPVNEWFNALNKKPTNWDLVFDGYHSAVDFPVCAYYKELMDKYPEAKVILTVRDPEKWYHSAVNTILNLSPPASMMLKLFLQAPFSKKRRNQIRLGMHNDKLLNSTFPDKNDQEKTIAVFNKHNEEVKKHVPADRLLVFEVKQGWEPLCTFLGVTVPDTPFPRTNQKEDFRTWALSLFDK